MPDSLMRHAFGMPGYSDLAEEAAAVLAAARHAARAVPPGAAGTTELTMIAAHVADLRAAMVRLATVELAVEAIYNQGRRDEREVIDAARGTRSRHASRKPHPHLRAVKALIPAAFIGSWGLIRYASRAARAHAALTALAVSAVGGAGAVYTLSPEVTTTLPANAAPAPAAAVPSPAALATFAPPAHRRGRHHHRPHIVPPRRVSPSPSSSPRHSPSPSPSPPASSRPSGEVTAPPVILSGGTGQLVLTADGGPVAWSLTCSPGITVSTSSGHLSAGQSLTITVTSASPLSGGTIWLWPGDIPVQVRAPSG